MGTRQGIHEVTSSGLTFSAKDQVPFAQQLLDTFLTNLYNTASDRYVGQNYGLIRVNSSEHSIQTVELIVKDEQGSIRLYRTIPFNNTLIR